LDDAMMPLPNIPPGIICEAKDVSKLNLLFGELTNIGGKLIKTSKNMKV